MVFCFPLYTTLRPLAEKRKWVAGDKEKVLAFLKKCSSAHAEKIYLLVRSYEQDSTGKINCNALPFEAKQLKTGVRFDLAQLPELLRTVLLCYSDLVCDAEQSAVPMLASDPSES